MANLIHPFGVVVCAAPGDYLFAKGTCASIKYFMPNTPIALLVDGNIATEPLEKTYGVQVIRRSDINDPWLRKHSFGWGITKMLAFWYAPFAHFLYLDSDTVIWGDVAQKLPLGQYDYITDIPFHGEKTPTAEHVKTWFFEPTVVGEKFPDFPWRDYISQYACTGTFVATRNMFTVQEYRTVLEFSEQYPLTFKFGEMGLLNFMVFRAYHQKKLNLGLADFQVIFPDFPIETLRNRFEFIDGEPLVKPDDMQVLHMPDKKPLVNNPSCYSLPMTYFRLKFLHDSEGLSGETAMDRLLQEDQQFDWHRKRSLRNKRLGVVKKLLSGHLGEWRRMGKRLGLSF